MKTTRTNANPMTARSALVAVVLPASPKSLPPVLVDADERVGGAIKRARRDDEISAKPGETTLFHVPGTKGPRRVAVVGVGDGATREDWMSAGSAIAKLAARLKTTRATVVVPDGTAHDDARTLLESIGLAAYRFDRFRGRGQDDDGDDATEKDDDRLGEIVIAGSGLDDATLAEIDVVVTRVNAARDLANTPGNHLPPPALAAYAKDLARSIPGLTCEVLGPKELEALGAGALLCVAQGSVHPAQLIVMRWNPKKAKGDEVLGIVGKGVTFDTGGISIKPSGGMEEMKMDMGGAAAAIESIAAIAQLKLPVRALAVIPSAENMPDGNAIKPGDVVTASNGKTIEVVNTDAEGRLILADALTYCARNGATRIIDFATLTGAMVIALGEVYAGLFGSDDAWTGFVFDAAEASGDLAWHMPLHEGYRPLIKSGVADLSNAAKKRQAGGVYAAMFLREFTDGLPWCHLDIAGTGMVNGAGTGYGVRLTTRLAKDMAER